MANQNSTSRLKQLLKVKEGIGKHFQNVGSLTLGGVAMTPAAISALIQAELDSMAASGKLKADLRVQIKAEHDARGAVSPLLSLLKAYVLATFGDTAAASSALDDFGYAPRKKGAKKLETKVEAKAKAQATRAAKKPAGSKQTQSINGQPAMPPTPTKLV